MKKRKTEIKGEKVFNPNYIFWILGFALTLWGNIYFFLEENIVSWLLMFFWLIFAIALFADAVYYVFTKQEIYFVHFWGYKWRLPWFYVSSITKYNFWESIGFRHLPGYEICYDQPYKGRVIRKVTFVALTPKVKKYLNNFYRGKIDFEKKLRKKKR